MRRALAFTVLITLAACQTPCPDVTPTSTTVAFRCDDGSDLQVTFSRQPDFARVVQEGYAPVTLPARITGSGYRYAQEGAELRGRGVEARWSRPGAAETLCRQAPPAS